MPIDPTPVCPSNIFRFALKLVIAKVEFVFAGFDEYQSGAFCGGLPDLKNDSQHDDDDVV